MKLSVVTAAQVVMDVVMDSKLISRYVDVFENYTGRSFRDELTNFIWRRGTGVELSKCLLNAPSMMMVWPAEEDILELAEIIVKWNSICDTFAGIEVR